MKELAKIGEDDENGNNEKKDDSDNKADEQFNDPRFLFANYRQMSSFSSEPMTPQKQFLLLSQSLRHPDGSSNPDVSSKTPEDEVMVEDIINCNNQEPSVIEEEVKPKKKSEMTFAARLLRLFSYKKSKNKNPEHSSKRSQSCDRQLEKTVLKNDRSISASSSPLKQRHKMKSKDDIAMTPVSCLSLAQSTEWEYQMKQDQDNANSRPGDRKSSGYDSLEERENSSLDSSHDIMDNVTDMLGNTLNYAVPSDVNTNNYDDIHQLKMDISRHPNILRNNAY